MILDKSFLSYVSKPIPNSPDIKLGVIVLLLIITVIVMYIKKERHIDNEEDNTVEITSSFDNPMFKAVETVHYEETTH